MRHRTRILLSLFAALMTGAPGAASAETWAIQVVDAGSAGAASTSLGLNAGYPVISYFGAPRNLNFAALDAQSKLWTLRRVDAGGEYSSLAVDGSGIVHVGYIDANTLDLKYWRYNAGQGSIQVIDSETGQGGMNFFNSIQVDAQGTPRISYYHWRTSTGLAADRLRYAVDGASSWSTEPVDSVPGRGKYQSLALDAAGNSQIAYYDTARTLRLAVRGASTWTSQQVDAAGDPGRFNSLAVDASGDPHVSYIAAIPNQLRYAFQVLTVWRFEDVAGVGAVENSSVTSLALDASGNPHIAYYDAATDSLKYASRSSSGVWTTQRIDAVGSTGGYCSLKLDSGNRPIISYYDATTRSIKIAYGDYPDGDLDGIPNVFDPCPTNADCNSNGIVDGREGGTMAGAPGTVGRLPDESIFGCGSLAALYGAGGPPRGGPPADLLFLLAPGVYLFLKRSGYRGSARTRFSARA